jgi:hypothetical protein
LPAGLVIAEVPVSGTTALSVTIRSVPSLALARDQAIDIGAWPKSSTT